MPTPNSDAKRYTALADGQLTERYGDEDPLGWSECRPVPDNLGQAIREALGAASICWESMHDTGVFDTRRALAISEDLESWVGSYLARGQDRLRRELEQHKQAIARTVAQMREYQDAAKERGDDSPHMVNSHQVIGLLSLTWPDGNYSSERGKPGTPPPLRAGTHSTALAERLDARPDEL